MLALFRAGGGGCIPIGVIIAGRIAMHMPPPIEAHDENKANPPEHPGSGTRENKPSIQAPNHLATSLKAATKDNDYLKATQRQHIPKKTPKTTPVRSEIIPSH